MPFRGYVGQRNDADAVGFDAVVYADVTVVAEQRSVLFPSLDRTVVSVLVLMLGGLFGAGVVEQAVHGGRHTETPGESHLSFSSGA